ncbi:MAG: mucoidy inhibitor MuiA family protein [Candidatus Hydrogenedentota bacterium]|nr:MAG: mucoidy inhibitor MuiA family protein [Candidatus Hydrogenedentota bacterium]
MKKYVVILLALCFFLYAQDKLPVYDLPIKKVMLYQNKARVFRSGNIRVKKGNNVFYISGLTPRLEDSTVLAKLPANAKARVLSVTVEKKALLEKRRKKLQELEKKLEALREKDAQLLDELKIIRKQTEFLASVSNFQKEEATKDLKTRMPSFDVWRKTMMFLANSSRNLAKSKRDIEKKREKLGKQIQKVEFEIGQIGGWRYLNKFRKQSQALLKNRSALQVQQYNNPNEIVITERDFSSLETEKRAKVEIYSYTESTVAFELSYFVRNCSWNMRYDLRANTQNKNVLLSLYADIYQQSSEDWNKVKLILSTGHPRSLVQTPYLATWILREKRLRSRNGDRAYKKKYRQKDFITSAKTLEDNTKEEERYSNVSTIQEAASEVEFTLKGLQSIPSQKGSQKKFVTDFYASKANSAHFFYELYPASSPNGFLRVELMNSTPSPWLKGKAQIFLDNELMGTARIPFTRKQEKVKLTLTEEKRLKGIKRLVKTFQDTKGVFSKKQRIRYSYEIELESFMPQAKEVFVYDRIPVSNTEKIEVEIENLNINWLTDRKTKADYQYKQGLRTWKLRLKPKEKKMIRYDVVITAPKDIVILGLK